MRKSQLLLNCDMGEGFGAWQMGADAELMPYIDQTNIACGFHAGEPALMQATIALAKQYQVAIGVHPAYPDLAGFGRRSMRFSGAEIGAIVQYQIGALQALCRAQNVSLAHVKPHGALYNDMQQQRELFEQVCQAVVAVAPGCPLLTLAGAPTSERVQWQLEVATSLGVSLQFEAFADRRYEASGQLRARHHADAVLTDSASIVSQVAALCEQGGVTTATGEWLELQADTLCLHGDNPAAPTAAKAIREYFKNLVE